MLKRNVASYTYIRGLYECYFNFMFSIGMPAVALFKFIFQIFNGNVTTPGHIEELFSYVVLFNLLLSKLNN